MTLHQLSPAAAAANRASRLRRRVDHLAALAWWMLRLHVAERHHLPRSALGPPPRMDGR
ncbi:MAG: hypothetical protein JWP86_1944 [Phenylobacterium sp.]|nr:hypothetical protein [Phenylobacterium sp.]MDB5494607.1 hypothetical protein [Phenylobacterium sp.]